MKNLKFATCLWIFQKYDVEMYEYIKDVDERNLNMGEVSSYARLLRDSKKKA